MDTRTARFFKVELEPTRMNWKLSVSHYLYSSYFNIGSILQKKLVADLHHRAKYAPGSEVRGDEGGKLAGN